MIQNTDKGTDTLIRQAVAFSDIEFTPEYLELNEQYEKMFGHEFDGIPYTTEQSIEMMKECLKTGKAYDLLNDPNYNPKAYY